MAMLLYACLSITMFNMQCVYFINKRKACPKLEHILGLFDFMNKHIIIRGSGQCVLVIHITDDHFEFFDLLSVNSPSRSYFCKLYMSISSICCRNQKLRNTISMNKKPYAYEVLARGIFFSIKALKGIFIGFKDV